MSPLSEEQLQRLEAFKNCFVEQPIVTQIFADFDRLRFNHQLGGSQQCMLVTGDTGVGKTELTRHYQSRAAQRQYGGYTHKPVLLSRISSKASLESTLIELHKDLGQAFATKRQGRSKEQSLTESLVRLLTKCRTELIILDEFHELLEFQSNASRAAIANRLKFISEKTEIPIVLVGMPWAEKIAEEPQWGRRLINRRVIPYFKLSEEPKHYLQFLMGLAIRMPLETPPKLEERHTAYALFAACRGRISVLKELLYEAVKLPLRERAGTLTIEHMAQTFRLWWPDVVNPFELEVDEIQVSEALEYSHYDFEAPKGTAPIIETTFTQQLPISQLLTKSRTLKAAHKS
ncbi:TniB family NTP-binding protein [Ferrimonas balearica]|uniref:TniB family NTP-binding protein n=1 Tax=Ferrimonas balearica TaxID=44012 RepID=UPI001F298CEA|nr:TniB family NTP-binding protein [Ferrimonas balearica]MBY6094667.1 TniB family NTP-binding protein [Ferrimonas balearica]